MNLAQILAFKKEKTKVLDAWDESTFFDVYETDEVNEKGEKVLEYKLPVTHELIRDFMASTSSDSQGHDQKPRVFKINESNLGAAISRYESYLDAKEEGAKARAMLDARVSLLLKDLEEHEQKLKKTETEIEHQQGERCQKCELMQLESSLQRMEKLVSTKGK